MAQTTKRALAASLKKLLQKKTLDKITVVDIVEDCEVNRQTFYYHFRDIYDLTEWIFTTETIKELDGKKSYETWQQGYLKIFEYIAENKYFITNIYYSCSREVLMKFLYDQTYKLLIDVIEEKAGDLKVRKEDKAFIAQFYKYGFVGLVLEWIGNGMKQEPEKIVEHLSILVRGDITKALTKFRQDQKLNIKV